MLGKLLKYELKANLLFYIIMTVAIAGITLAAGCSVELMVKTEMDNPYIALSCISVIMLYIVVLITASVFTTVIVFKRFYSNNFSQEGYLTFTLPVTAKQIYWSKFISALIWNGWTYVLIVLSIIGVMLCPSLEITMTDILDIFYFFTDIYDGSVWMIILYILQLVVSMVYAIVLMYLSICIGQNFNVHRVIGAIGAYLVVNWAVGIVCSVISTSVLMLWGIIDEAQNEYASGFSGEMFMNVSFIIKIVVYIGVIIGGYFYSIHKMNKGLNLK